MIAGFLAFALLQAASPQTQGAIHAEGATASAAEPSLVVLYLFARARAYYDAARIRKCRGSTKEQAEALNRRFEATTQRMISRFGAKVRDFPRSGETVVMDPKCEHWIPFGYENALAELERQFVKEAVS